MCLAKASDIELLKCDARKRREVQVQREGGLLNLCERTCLNTAHLLNSLQILFFINIAEEGMKRGFESESIGVF